MERVARAAVRRAEAALGSRVQGVPATAEHPAEPGTAPASVSHSTAYVTRGLQSTVSASA